MYQNVPIKNELHHISIYEKKDSYLKWPSFEITHFAQAEKPSSLNSTSMYETFMIKAHGQQIP